MRRSRSSILVKWMCASALAVIALAAEPRSVALNEMSSDEVDSLNEEIVDQLVNFNLDSTFDDVERRRPAATIAEAASAKSVETFDAELEAFDAVSSRITNASLAAKRVVTFAPLDVEEQRVIDAEELREPTPVPLSLAPTAAEEGELSAEGGDVLEAATTAPEGRKLMVEEVSGERPRFRFRTSDDDTPVNESEVEVGKPEADSVDNTFASGDFAASDLLSAMEPDVEQMLNMREVSFESIEKESIQQNVTTVSPPSTAPSRARRHVGSFSSNDYIGSFLIASDDVIRDDDDDNDDGYATDGNESLGRPPAIAANEDGVAAETAPPLDNIIASAAALQSEAEIVSRLKELVENNSNHGYHRNRGNTRRIDFEEALKVTVPYGAENE